MCVVTGFARPDVDRALTALPKSVFWHDRFEVDGLMVSFHKHVDARGGPHFPDSFAVLLSFT